MKFYNAEIMKNRYYQTIMFNYINLMYDKDTLKLSTGNYYDYFLYFKN